MVLGTRLLLTLYFLYSAAVLYQHRQRIKFRSHHAAAGYQYCVIRTAVSVDSSGDKNVQMLFVAVNSGTAACWLFVRALTSTKKSRPGAGAPVTEHTTEQTSAAATASAVTPPMPCHSSAAAAAHSLCWRARRWLTALRLVSADRSPASKPLQPFFRHSRRWAPNNRTSEAGF